MYLKEVQMENFKSFGRKMVVPFEPGYTGITGPNGSGKSNIGDAILFVLSPSTPRAIRAGRLTDLIFNGAQNGTAANYCQVSLVFDNRERVMPIDTDDVVLTRKVKRHKTKEDPDGYKGYFYVNDRASKKKEFVDILQHARISASGYNITQQGDVLQICRMSNVERRKILDDIAGVTTFDKDIDQANKRKESVDENLGTIQIVLTELEHSIRQLEKDKSAAERYRVLQNDIGRCKGLMAMRRREDLEAQIHNVQQQIEEFSKKREENQAQLITMKAQYKEIQILFVEVQQRIREEGGEEAQKMQEDINAARDRMVRLEEKIHHAKDSAADSDEDLVPIREELRRIQKELLRTQKTTEDATKLHDEKHARLEVAQKERDDVRNLISSSDKGAMELNRELGKLKKHHEDTSVRLHESRLESDRLTEKVNMVERGLAECTEELASFETDQKELQWQIDELAKVTSTSNKGDNQKRLFALKKEQAELSKQNEDLENRIRRLQRELAQLNAQRDAAERASGGFGRAVEDVMAARDAGHIRGIIGTISELADAPEEYQEALQTAAGANMQAVVVEDDSVAQQCIEYVKQNRSGRVKCLPLNKLIPGKPRGQALMKKDKQGCLGFALDLVDYNPRYQNAFWQVFGDTLVVDNMNAGRNLMGGVRMVTLGGELFEAGGAMIGGAKGKKSAVTFSNQDRGRSEEIMAEIRSAEDAQERVLSDLGNVADELRQLQDILDQAGRQDAGAADRLKEMQKRQSRLQEKASEQDSVQETLQTERTKLVEQRQSIAATILELEQTLNAMDVEREEKGRLLMKGGRKDLREKAEALEEEIHQLRGAVMDAGKQRDVATKQAELVQERLEELQARSEELVKAKEDHLQHVTTWQAEHDKCRGEVEALMKLERKASGALKQLHDAKDKHYKELVDLEAKMQKVQDRMETSFSLISNAKAKLPTLEESLGEAMVDMKEHPVELQPGEVIAAFDDLRRDLRAMEARLERLGPVNMRALDEFDAQSERRTQLLEEKQRLESQKSELETLVAEIQTRKKVALMTVFDAINENFANVYKRLSMEGKALMELENPENPFEGGLILKAQPMGKKVTRLDALSGGEQSLTSMAFIFAIQMYEPSPFYYFDEVDQNLDAVNSELLAKLVKDNAQYAQFIQVSLRKITLKEAAHVYGVTQQTAGLSDIIANFDINQLRDEDEDPKHGRKSKGKKVAAEIEHAPDTDEPEEDRDDAGLQQSIEGMMDVEVRQ